MDIDEENIHLQLINEDTPIQIMEADEDEEDIKQVVKSSLTSTVLSGRHNLSCTPEDLVVVVENQEILDGSQQVIISGGTSDTNSVDGLILPDHHENPLIEKEEPISDEVSEVCESIEVPKVFIPPSQADDRFSVLETEIKRNQSRLDGFSQELKLLLVEVNIVCEWITENFGVQLIDKNSQIFKHIHDSEDVEEMSQTLSLLRKNKGTVRRSARRKPMKPKKSDPFPTLKKRGRGRPKLKKKQNSDFEDSDDGTVEADDDIFDPPECLLNTDVEEEFFKDDSNKPKRRRGRKQTVKKELKGTEDGCEQGTNDEVKDEVKEDDELTADGKKKRKWKSQPRSLQCEECGKILKADSSLRWHMLMHADLRPVECTEPGCGKTFRDKSKLAQHQKIHNGEKSEKCRYCARGFLRKKDLIVHERTHTGEKPYACTSCPKSFNIKDHLTIHLRVHTGERPYRCPTCDKAFSQANSLRIHKKIHLKQASDYVPTPRKPRAPRKPKGESVPENTTSPSSSIHTIDLRGGGIEVELEESKPITGDEGGADVVVETSTPVEHHHSLVQTLFQAQTLNLVDPVQQAWNYVTNPNTVVVAQQHQHQHQPSQSQHNTQHIHQRGFTNQTLGTLGHLSVVQGHGGTTFKIQPITYHTHPQQQQQQQTQQHTQSVNIIRNPLPGQAGPFVSAQFHDPNNFRHFPN